MWVVVDISFAFDHKLHALDLPLPRSQCESCTTIFSLKLHVCVAVDEQTHTIHMPIPARIMKASGSIVDLLVHIYLGIDH
jgi:hypothetical protein